MNQAGTPPQLAYLDIDDLWVNTTYQRGILQLPGRKTRTAQHGGAR